MKKLLLPLLLLTLCGCTKQGDKTPLGWCVWEIQKHEGYEECVYTYQELNPYETIQEERKNDNYKINAYIITTYIYQEKAEWLCFVEYKNIYKKYLNEKDIYTIDFDILY